MIRSESVSIVFSWVRPSLLALALAAAIAPRAAAQETPDTLIDRGFDLREHGDDEGGLALFTQAYEAGHSPRALAQMGLAEQALGRWVLAEQHVQGALAQATDVWIVAHQEVLADALHTIQARLATLELRGGVDGADVLVDGDVVGHLPLAAPLRLVAGALQVEVRKEGYLPWSHTVVLAPGETGRETVVLHRRPTEPTVETGGHAAPVAITPRAPHGDPGRTWRALGWTSIAVGLGGGALGAIALGLREVAVAKFNSDECLSPASTRIETCPSQWDLGHAFETTAVVSFITAGVLGILGAVLIAIAPGAAPRDAAPPANALVCGPGPGQIGVGCAGTF